MSFSHLYDEADNRARMKRLADRNYIEELRKQKDEVNFKRYNDKRQDVKEAQKIIFGTVPPGTQNISNPNPNNNADSTSLVRSNVNSLNTSSIGGGNYTLNNNNNGNSNYKTLEVAESQQGDNFKFNPELERTKSVTLQLNNRLSQLEDRLTRDLQGLMSNNADKLQSMESRLYNHERHSLAQIDDLKTRSFQQTTEVAGKVTQLDRHFQEDHQRQAYIVEEINRLKDNLQSNVVKSADLAGRIERCSKDIQQSNQRGQELLHVIKDHDLQLGKLTSHISTEMDTTSKRITMMNTELTEKLQFESKTRAAQDMKYDQLLKDLRTYVARHLDDTNNKVDSCKQLVQDNYQKTRSEIASAASEVKTIIQHLEKSQRDHEVFVKDQVLRQILTLSDTVKTHREEAHKNMQDSVTSLNHVIVRNRQEDLERLSAKEAQLEAYKESINSSIRQIQDHSRHEELELNRKIGYVEELVREEANARLISEQNVNRLVQENRGMLVSSLEDVDLKVRGVTQDLTQLLEKTSAKQGTDLLNRIGLEKRRLDEVEGSLNSTRKTLKDRGDELENRIKLNTALVERMDQDMKHHFSAFDVTLKDTRTVFEGSLRNTDSRLDELHSNLNSFKVDMTQQLEQKVIHFESVLQVQQEELEKCPRRPDLERLEAQWSVNIEESNALMERNRKLLIDEVQSKLQVTEDQIVRRLSNLDQQQQVLKEGLELQQNTFSQFHQLILNALNKNQSELNHRAMREDVDRANVRLENMFKNLQSDVSLLTKQVEYLNTSNNSAVYRRNFLEASNNGRMAASAAPTSTVVRFEEPALTDTNTANHFKAPIPAASSSLDDKNNADVTASAVKKRAVTAKPKNLPPPAPESDSEFDNASIFTGADELDDDQDEDAPAEPQLSAIPEQAADKKATPEEEQEVETKAAVPKSVPATSASKLNSVPASKPNSVPPSKPNSVPASKPNSVPPSKPTSTAASRSASKAKLPSSQSADKLSEAVIAQKVEESLSAPEDTNTTTNVQNSEAPEKEPSADSANSKKSLVASKSGDINKQEDLKKSKSLSRKGTTEALDMKKSGSNPAVKDPKESSNS